MGKREHIEHLETLFLQHLEHRGYLTHSPNLENTKTVHTWITHGLDKLGTLEVIKKHGRPWQIGHCSSLDHLEHLENLGKFGQHSHPPILVEWSTLTHVEHIQPIC